MSEVERMDRSRRRMLFGALVGFTLWQGGSVATQLLSPGGMPRRVAVALALAALAGSVFWLANLIQMVRWMRSVRLHPDAEASLNDERVRESRLRAFAIGFAAVLAAQAIPILSNIAASVSAQLTILVGCTTAIGAFLVLDRE